MLYNQEFICGWELEDTLDKISQIVLVFAQTKGKANSNDEQFYYVAAYLLKGLRDINELITEGSIVIDFCIDQKVGDTRQPHDRGPHIRIPKTKLFKAYKSVTQIMN